MIILYFACQTPNEPSETKLEDTVVTVDEPSQEPTQEPSIEIETCDEVKTLPKKLRRLTDTQYKNAVIQILDLEFDDASFKIPFRVPYRVKHFIPLRQTTTLHKQVVNPSCLRVKNLSIYGKYSIPSVKIRIRNVPSPI